MVTRFCMLGDSQGRVPGIGNSRGSGGFILVGYVGMDAISIIVSTIVLCLFAALLYRAHDADWPRQVTFIGILQGSLHLFLLSARSWAFFLSCSRNRTILCITRCYRFITNFGYSLLISISVPVTSSLFYLNYFRTKYLNFTLKTFYLIDSVKVNFS